MGIMDDEIQIVLVLRYYCRTIATILIPVPHTAKRIKDVICIIVYGMYQYTKNVYEYARSSHSSCR